MGPISENGQSLVKGITQDSTGILANKIGLSVIFCINQNNRILYLVYRFYGMNL